MATTSVEKFLCEEDDPTEDNDVNMEEVDDQNNNDENDETGSVIKKVSTLQKLNKILSSVPLKLGHCTKTDFLLILLLTVEVKNMDYKDKIDYLLLHSFFNLKKEFKSMLGILKMTKEEFIKIFEEKTDFDTNKISDIYAAIVLEDGIKKIIQQFKEYEHKGMIDIEQTMSKIVKCELNKEEMNKNDNDKDEQKEGWKEFKIGDKIDVLDKWNKWYLSQILKRRKMSETVKESCANVEQIYIHYIGFAEKYDEWITLKDGKSDRIAAPNTKSKKKKKKKQQEEEGIKYKIKNFDELVKYIDSKYEAPNGRNRSGIGAEKYAHAQKHGPGGNLTKFIAWDKAKQYDRFHHSHYDWWMFPNDRDSWGQGRKYALFQGDIDDLLNLDGYIESYKLGARLVLRSWGWDMDKMEFIKNGTKAQKWTGYNVRLLKMLYSTIILKQWDVYKSVYKFCIGLLGKGDKFRSEPMMYEYLGLEKPSFSRRYRW